MTREELLRTARNTAIDVVEMGIGLTDREFTELMAEHGADTAVKVLTKQFVNSAARCVDEYFEG